MPTQHGPIRPQLTLWASGVMISLVALSAGDTLASYGANLPGLEGVFGVNWFSMWRKE